jgi:hypothetical protein
MPWLDPLAPLDRQSIRLIVVLPLAALVERLPGGLMHRGAPGEALPASHDDIDIRGIELDAVADAAGHFGRDQTAARTEKRVIRCSLR